MKWITIKQGRSDVTGEAHANLLKVKLLVTDLKCHFKEDLWRLVSERV